MAPATAAAVARGDGPKGEVIATARIAGIQAAKRTAELVPLCHPLSLSFVDVRLEVGRRPRGGGGEARTTGAHRRRDGGDDRRRGGALTVYDMVKGVERGVGVHRLTLLEKSGGKNGLARTGDRRGADHVLLARGRRRRGRARAGTGGAAASEAGLDHVHEVCPTIAPRSGRRCAASPTWTACASCSPRVAPGLTPDDVTPEATRDVLDREAPGYAETMRAASRGHTPLGILSRGVSGVRGRTLVGELPGNPNAIGQSWPVVAPTIEHAAATLER